MNDDLIPVNNFTPAGEKLEEYKNFSKISPMQDLPEVSFHMKVCISLAGFFVLVMVIYSIIIVLFSLFSLPFVFMRLYSLIESELLILVLNRISQIGYPICNKLVKSLGTWIFGFINLSFSKTVDFLYNMSIAVYEYGYVAAMYFCIIILHSMIYIVRFCMDLCGILKDFNFKKFTNPII